MANEEHLAILTQGVEAWNRWREGNGEIVPDLSCAKLSDAEIVGANLKDAILEHIILTWSQLEGTNFSRAALKGARIVNSNLKETNFSRASLGGVDLSGCSLNNANFFEARLIGADLSYTDLSGANLRDTDLTGAIFSRGFLNGAELHGSRFSGTVVGDIDLGEVKGLEKVIHHGPSSIGIDTIYKSKGKIPVEFLRGAGVPEEFIEYMPSLISGKAIQYYSCFISYSSKDEAFAHRLHTDLQARGVRCWFAPEDLKIGEKFRQRIDESIRTYDRLLLVLSEASIESAWVEKEAEAAYEKEQKEKRAVLFPIRLDGTVWETHQAWAADIRRTRHIGDFSCWKDQEAYQKAFERLLRDLDLGVEK